MPSRLVKVDFHGDQIDCVEHRGKVWVSVRSVCDALGVKAAAQREVLTSKPWATVLLINTVAEDGKNRAMFVIYLDCLPMWLAIIAPVLVAEAVRPKLVDYQKECARVLREYFLKPKGDLVPAALTRSICEEIVKPVMAMILEQAQRIESMSVRIERLDAAQAQAQANAALIARPALEKAARVAPTKSGKPARIDTQAVCRMLGVTRRTLLEFDRDDVFTVQTDGTGKTAKKFYLSDEIETYIEANANGTGKEGERAVLALRIEKRRKRKR